MDTKEFKGVIEDIVDARISKKGITKFVSAVVKTVNSNGSVDVYLPPDTEKIVSGVLNKTGENLSVGDSVELCNKNKKTNNAWVSVKHGTNFNVDKQITDTGWLYTSNTHRSDLGNWHNYNIAGTLYGRKVGNTVELNFQISLAGSTPADIFILNEAFRPIQKIYAVLRITDSEGSGYSCNISIDTDGYIYIADGAVLTEIDNAPDVLNLRGNVMYFV